MDPLQTIGLTAAILGLCRRRQWPDPLYDIYSSNAGFTCIVRVNNREYQTDTNYGNEMLARENAAMRAYLICRNFSVNDGMYPSGNRNGAVMQGLPVAIGTERRSICSEDLDTSASSGSRSGGSSPGSFDSGRIHLNGRRESGMNKALTYSNRHQFSPAAPR